MQGGRRIRDEQSKTAPLVSIITVVYNAREHLSELLNNVLAKIPDDFEFIVIDGNSTDGTLDLLQSCDDRIDYWLSEPDRGIYDAMNKAQGLARGYFLYHLNAGDKLITIPREELEAAARDDIDVVSFRVRVDENREFRPSSGFMLRLKNTLHHQGTFYRRETFVPYDLRFPVLADFDANQRLALGGAKIRTFDKIIAQHLSGGAADSINGYAEHSAIVRKNFGWLCLGISLALSEWKGIKIRRKAAFKRWLKL